MPPLVNDDPYAELKAAHAAGKTIQLNDNYSDGGPPDWNDIKDPGWAAGPECYRIKPEENPVSEIKHADLIRAVLDGKTVQAGYKDGSWEDCTPHEAIAEMVGNPDTAFRLKPDLVTKEQALRALAHMDALTHLSDEAAEHRATLHQFIEQQP